MQFSKISALRGEITVPGDKSISHRAVMLGALAEGVTEVHNFLQGDDCLSSIACFRNLGVEIENSRADSDNIVRIHGVGLHGLKEPQRILDAGNSGTTTRMITGILAGQKFQSTVTGDASIQKRPMKRVIDPLSMMGADITSIRENGCAPLLINGCQLKGIQYNSKIASAQVKSALLFAGLYADSPTIVKEPYISRNHSEIMLSCFGAKMNTDQNTVTIYPSPKLIGQKIHVPGDISSAAYFIAAALITPNSEVLIKNVGINTTRDGIIRVAREMGGDITLENINYDHGEHTADILVRSSSLHGVTIGGELIPALIDEIPIIAVMAAFADGKTIIRDASELKVKESNRLDVMVENLSFMGVDIIGTQDGMIINGGFPLTGTVIDSHLDHRVAMSFAVAGLNAIGVTKILESECVNVSYPAFFEDLESLIVH